MQSSDEQSKTEEREKGSSSKGRRRIASLRAHKDEEGKRTQKSVKRMKRRRYEHNSKRGKDTPGIMRTLTHDINSENT